MEITVYQRIKAYIDGNRISLNALAKTLNMNQSTVLRQVKGEQTLSSTLVENFLKAYPDVSAEWLMRGAEPIELGKTAEYIAEKTSVDYAADAIHPKESDFDDSVWKAKYEELEKRYDQLLSILGGGMKQANVG
jgi:hypothetical protein